MALFDWYRPIFIVSVVSQESPSYINPNKRVSRELFLVLNWVDKDLKKKNLFQLIFAQKMSSKKCIGLCQNSCKLGFCSFWSAKRFIFTLFVFVFVALSLTWMQPINFNLKIQRTGREVTILFWTKYYNNENFFDDGLETFNFIHNKPNGMFEHCPPPANRCRLTNNRSMVNQSEAIIFHVRDLEGLKWPEFRSPEQRWIFFNQESPNFTFQEKLLKNLSKNLRFNWTQTYR